MRNFSDPLELRENSLIGLPGLVGAVRRQTLSMVNEIGSEILETRAFLAFLPRLCEKLRGEPLTLPNIATWWCGQAAEREYVRANIKTMMISSAFSTRMKFDPVDAAVLGGQLRDTTFDSVQELLEYEGANLVAQEDVALSTSPAYVDGKLVPRPGQHSRIHGAHGGRLDCDARRLRPYRHFRRCHRREHEPGGMIADVWVVADNAPAKIDTMMPTVAYGDARATQNRSTQPRGGKSVLARPLCRAGRSFHSFASRL